MKKNTFFLIFCLILSISSYSQKGIEKYEFMISINALNVEYGFFNVKIKESLANDYSFILKSNYRHLISINVFEPQIFFKDIIGLDMGIYFMQSDLNSQKIYSEIQQHVENVSIEIPKTNYGENIVPINGGFSSFYLKMGLVGKIKLNQIEIVPLASVFLPLRKNGKSFVDANVIDLSTNENFFRRYEYNDFYNVSYRIGIDIRYLIGKQKLGYLGLKFGYDSFKSSGFITTNETYENGNQKNSSPLEYHRRISNPYLGVQVGFTFPIRKKVVSSKS